jgi:hypothetical protein
MSSFVFDIAEFRQTLPEFADTIIYTDAFITLAYNVALASYPIPQTSCNLDDNQLKYLMYYLIAHFLFIDTKLRNGTMQADQSSAQVQSASVGETSVTLKSGSGAGESSTSILSTTEYGKRYLRLLRASMSKFYFTSQRVAGQENLRGNYGFGL